MATMIYALIYIPTSVALFPAFSETTCVIKWVGKEGNYYDFLSMTVQQDNLSRRLTQNKPSQFLVNIDFLIKRHNDPDSV
jgi:hypothetical protein